MVYSIINETKHASLIKELFENSPKWVPASQYRIPVITSFKQRLYMEANTEIFSMVEEQPDYIGGMPALYDFIGKNQVYPKIAVRKDIQGKVFVSFVITPTGELDDVKVIKGIGYGCDEDAVRLL